MEPRWPRFTWDDASRRYRGPDGRYVPRRAVRQALDEVIDGAGERIRADARRLQAGAINLPEWQLRTEANVKLIHTAAAAAATGGWAQTTAADWAVAARRIKNEYRHLARFARQVEAGLPLDARFLARAASYADAGSATYERVSRRADLATGRVIAESRRTHSGHPCHPCLAYEALGWVEPDVLPEIGEDCDCGQRCRCAFERRFR